MRTTLLIALCTFVLTLLCFWLAGAAHAGCRWTWDCTSGRCRQVPVCTNVYDIPPPRTPSVPPIPTPTVRPIPRPIVPPVGTMRCGPRYTCGPYGCRWQTLCR